VYANGRSGSENLDANNVNFVCNSTPSLGLMLNIPFTGGPLIAIETANVACLAESLNVTEVSGGKLNGASTKLNFVELKA